MVLAVKSSGTDSSGSCRVTVTEKEGAVEVRMPYRMSPYEKKRLKEVMGGICDFESVEDVYGGEEICLIYRW